MRAISAAVLLCVFGSACVTVHQDTRTERGPVLSATEREVPLEGSGVQASVDARWPMMTLKFESYQLCRRERVEEVVEERITESYAPSAGPSFALGVTGTVVGAGLFGLRGAFSNEPNTRFIDETGHYGPAPRQVATGWSYVLLGVGVPALVTGIIGLVQSGESVEQAKVQQVASAFETQCHLRPAEGQVELVRADGEGPELVTVPTLNGRVTLTAQQLSQMRLASVQLNGQLVLLPEEEAQELGAFLSCSQVLPTPSSAGLARMSEEAIVSAYNTARQCEPVGGEAAKDAVKAYSEEVSRRRGGGVEPQLPAGPVPLSFDAAVEAYQPRARYEPGAPVGSAAILAGTLVRKVDDATLVLDLGGQEVLAIVTVDAPWRASFSTGARVRAVGVLLGEQAAGGQKLPAFRAVWMQEG